ncbi:MAG: lipid-A-disaccharide synthase [bacterium]|nr:lipid-A-disaccharide synthase [bacterium]
MKKVVIITGEASGDLYGGRLTGAIKGLLPDVELEGMGGSNMLAAGVNLRFDMADLSAIGAIEVINTIPKFFRRLKEVSNYLKTTKPDLLILIDFPEFNMRLAKTAKRLGIPTVYYIPPTAWAWRRGRAKTMAKSVDKVISIFDFEAKVYQEAGNNVEFVGHPLLDIVVAERTKEEACQAFNLDSTKKIIGILPGSRKKEIKVLLPIMLSAVEEIHRQLPDVQFILPLAPTLSLKDISPLTTHHSPLTIVENATYEVMNISDLLIVASGTATLEAACLQTPMIIVYKVNWLTGQLGKLLVHTGGFIGLPNIVAGKQVVPELLQVRANPGDICHYAIDLLQDGQKKEAMLKELRQVREKLGSSGATRRAAEDAIKCLK